MHDLLFVFLNDIFEYCDAQWETTYCFHFEQRTPTIKRCLLLLIHSMTFPSFEWSLSLHCNHPFHKYVIRKILYFGRKHLNGIFNCIIIGRPPTISVIEDHSVQCRTCKCICASDIFVLYSIYRDYMKVFCEISTM